MQINRQFIQNGNVEIPNVITPENSKGAAMAVQKKNNLA